MSDIQFARRGVLFEDLRARYQGIFRPIITTPLTGGLGTMLPITTNNDERYWLTIINNNATNTAFVSPDQTAAWGACIPIPAGGGMVSFSLVEDAMMPGLAWFCQSGGVAFNLLVMEIVRDVYLGPLVSP